jgi:multidrug resistance efflux pump
MSDSKRSQPASRPPRNKPRKRFRPRNILLGILALIVLLLVASALIPTARWVEGDGYLMTDDEAEIRPSVEGAIEDWLVRSGTQIAKDDVLIQLKDALFQADLMQARADLLVTQAELLHLREQQRLDGIVHREEIFRAERQLEAMQEQLALMEKTSQGAISPQEIRDARRNVDLAQSRLKEMRASRDKLDQARLGVQKARVEAVEKRIAAAEVDVELRKLRAPLDGVVQFNSFEPGEVVKPDHVLGQVFDRSAWVVKLKLPERAIAFVREGQPVEVELAAYPAWRHGELTAKVSRITRVVTPQATGDGIIYVEAMLDNPDDDRLHPGMKASARIDTGRTSLLMNLLGQ